MATFIMEWKGGTDKMWKSLEEKYGAPKKNITLFAWIKDGTRMIHGMGKKSAVGNGKIYEQSVDRIIYAESDQGTYGVSNKIIFYKPTLFGEIKHALENVESKNKAKQNAVDDASKSSLSD